MPESVTEIEEEHIIKELLRLIDASVDHYVVISYNGRRMTFPGRRPGTICDYFAPPGFKFCILLALNTEHPKVIELLARTRSSENDELVFELKRFRKISYNFKEKMIFQGRNIKEQWHIDHIPIRKFKKKITY
jgi:hypothetical protein